MSDENFLIDLFQNYDKIPKVEEKVKNLFGEYFADGVAKYHSTKSTGRRKKRDPLEEYITQVFVHILLQNENFRIALLKKISPEFPLDNWIFKAENKVAKYGEFDVFATAKDTTLIIENKVGDEIKLDSQLGKYAKYLIYEDKNKHKYLYSLTLFSGGFTDKWSSKDNTIETFTDKKIREYVNSKVAEIYKVCKQCPCKSQTEKSAIQSGHLYWSDIYEILQSSYDGKNKDMLLELFNHDFYGLVLSDAFYHGYEDKNWVEYVTKLWKELKYPKFKKLKDCHAKHDDDLCYISFEGSKMRGARAIHASKSPKEEFNCYLRINDKKTYVNNLPKEWVHVGENYQVKFDIKGNELNKNQLADFLDKYIDQIRIAMDK